MDKNKKLYKSCSNKIIDGVCAGIADYIGVDPTIIRVVYAILTMFSVGLGGLILYVVLAVIMPREPMEGYQYNEYQDK